MKIETVDIELLKLDPKNARKHNDKNLDAIKGSLQKFGQQKPIVIDEFNIIIAGNGLFQAAKELGYRTITIVRTNLKGRELTAYGLADNRTTDLSTWDDDILGELLHDLRENDFDLTSIGFDTTELDNILNEGQDDLDFNPEDEEKEFNPDIKDKSENSEPQTEFALKVTFNSDEERQELFIELNERGLKVKAV